MWPVIAVVIGPVVLGVAPELWRAIRGAGYRRPKTNLYRSSHGMRRTSRGARRYGR